MKNIIDLQHISAKVLFLSRSQNIKTLRRDTSDKTDKCLAFRYLRLIQKILTYVKYSKKVPKLPNKLPNEF